MVNDGVWGIMKLANELGGSAWQCCMPCSKEARVTGCPGHARPTQVPARHPGPPGEVGTSWLNRAQGGHRFPQTCYYICLRALK